MQLIFSMSQFSDVLCCRPHPFLNEVFGRIEHEHTIDIVEECTRYMQNAWSDNSALVVVFALLLG
jgi:hypothetical protein